MRRETDLLHRWEYFKDDTAVSLDGATTNPFDATVLNRFSRAEPIHGSIAELAGKPDRQQEMVGRQRPLRLHGRRAELCAGRDFSAGLDRIGNNMNRSS